ncbi:MAG TPA: HD domain-containing protein [Aggregatilineales bacterium]|nr:HD domain-containing protein [Aggregatilineales bacterium]
MITERIRQTIQFVFAWGRPVRDDLAQEYLSDAEFDLYLKMSRPERQHHLRVLNDLLAAGHTHAALLKAALLHDVGKTRFRFSLPERALVVPVKAFLPGRFRQWSKSEPRGWKRPFVISAQHPDWSADMCAVIHVNPVTVELIRRHQTRLDGNPQTETDRLLLLLQAADDRS